MYGYIYKTTNLTDGRIYVGQHTSPWVRKHQKLDPKYFGSGIHLKNSIQKHGIENFECEILEWCETEEALNEREHFWIHELKSLFSESNGFNYNLTDQPYVKRSDIKRNTFAEYNSKRDYNELSEHNKGSKMMTNGIEQKWVYKNDIQNMLDAGWIIGSCKKRNFKNGKRIPWNKNKKGIQKNRKSVPGYIRVTNGSENTTIKPEYLDEYLEKGYWRGITKGLNHT